MTGAGGGGGDNIKGWREAARMAASVTLLPTSVELMHPESRALPLTGGLQSLLFTNRT
jgi:hypothetical protein